ncbi:MAG: 2Fe-2S iron-sulfur cluster-binding protein [Gammaproteobacteria bacterium]
MQTTEPWLYNYALSAVAALLMMQHSDYNADLSSLIIQATGMLLLLAAALKLASMLKNGWQRHALEKQQRNRIADYWQQKAVASELSASRQNWSGYKAFTVSKKITESDEVVSFYLTPADGKPLPDFRPGQYITLQVQPPRQAKPVMRCYSLSDSYSPDFYRISVKKEAQGLVSNYLHQQINEGDAIETRAPQGKFYLDMDSTHPVVLIAGGIGITPLLTMLKTVAEHNDQREVHLFYSVRQGSQIVMKDYLTGLAENRPQFHLHLCYSRPAPEDNDSHHSGRITLELLRSTLPSSNYHFYLCGAQAMMQDLSRDLKAWAVPEQDIHFESFGSGAVAKKTAKSNSEKHSVFFRKSNKLLPWTADDSTLLEMAEDHRIPVEYACRSGQCGMCKAKIDQGEVEYLTEPTAEIEDGSCLTCISIPKGELVVDL